MARILAIDYGKKRTGLAVTDPLQIIANPLDYIASHNLIPYLRNYCDKENVEAFVIGIPVNLSGEGTDITKDAFKIKEIIAKEFPESRIFTHDEKYTSKMALKSMIDAGSTKKQRKVKGNIDKISATIILQSFLESRK